MDAPSRPPARAQARREHAPSGLFLRRLHGWAGAFFAPGILFFAATGLLQVFDLHKVVADRAYDPPAFVLTVAQLHKSQRLRRAPDAASHAPAKRSHKTASAPEPVGLGQALLKAYAAALSVALAVTALVGLSLALRNRRDRAVALVLLVAGVLLPGGLLLLG